MPQIFEVSILAARSRAGGGGGGGGNGNMSTGEIHATALLAFIIIFLISMCLSVVVNLCVVFFVSPPFSFGSLITLYYMVPGSMEHLYTKV
jgi:hypothetical protein